MARMFRVLGFTAFLIALMALAGNLIEMALLFLFQTAAFMLLGYMNLREKTYLFIFWGYLIVSFLGITYWSFFQSELPVI
jgi:CHASE2 domain-containing sensor protein